MTIRRVGFILVLCLTSIALLVWADNPASKASAESPQTSANAPSGATQYTFLPLILGNIPQPKPLWRFGAATSQRPISAYNPTDVMGLRLGVYSDWLATLNAPQPYGMEYMPTIRLKQWKLLPDGVTKTEWCVGCPYATDPLASTYNHYTYTASVDVNQIDAMTAAHPGMTWVIGNEIDRVDWANGGRQDEIVPGLYADAYNYFYTAIKTADPTAQVAIGGVIQGTPLRLQYLQMVWDAYLSKYKVPMPVDVWNIHGFVLQEMSCTAHPVCWGAEIPAGLNPAIDGAAYTALDNKNFTISWQLILAMRTWMKNLSPSQQNKPLIISEYGVLIPPSYSADFSFTNVRDSYMYPSFNDFLSATDCSLSAIDSCHLVQRWVWYSLDDDSGNPQSLNGNLFYSGLWANPQGIAPLGTYWTQYVQSLAPGSTKPYAPVHSAPVPTIATASAAPLANSTTPANCSADQQVRLLYYDPSPPEGMVGVNRAPTLSPTPSRESTLCVPPPSK